LGNLSITFDNAVLSNLGFAAKKRMLAEKSRVRLNQMLLTYESFTEEEIRDRAARLLKKFFDTYNICINDAASDDDAEPVLHLKPQQWLDKVRTQIGTPELDDLTFANTWKAICDHLEIPIGQDSAHRRLENWIDNHQPLWPSTYA
jgi:hypothetical protein